MHSNSPATPVSTYTSHSIGIAMNAIAWEMPHSVETNASLAFAWNYWTDVANWDDPPATFTLNGPFAPGSRGTTQLPGAQLHWLIREVTPHRSATIEMPLDGAALSFAWQLDALADSRTKLTQRLTLAGQNAAAFLSQVQSSFAVTLPAGMAKLAAAIAAAYANRLTPATKTPPSAKTPARTSIPD